MRYLIGIDIGTSSCKTALFDSSGGLVAQASREYPVYHPHSGWAEQNPDEWWACVCEALRATISDAKVPSESIAGVGVDGQSWSAIAIDREGSVLSNTPIWMDSRADDICRELEEAIGSDEIFRLCGNPMKPSYTTPKILWYKRELPEVFTRTYKILQSNSFIVYRLTGCVSQDLSQGYGLHCFDMANGRFDVEMCRRMGISTDLLPPLFRCHDVVGKVSSEAAALTGLPEGVPVVAGGLDAACGALGAGVLEPGQTQEQGGQAGGMSICVDRPLADRRLILSFHVVPGCWLLQGGTVGGGGIMRWIERELGEAERLHYSGKSSFAMLDEEAARIPPGSDGLVFLPYMSGERSPIWDKDASGVFFGLDYSKTKAHMVRAALEGAAYALRHNLETAEEAGARADILNAVGGAAKSSLWTQMKADVTGRIINVPDADTATAWGAAILAGVGTHVFESFAEAVDKTVRIKRTYRPDSATAAAYDKGYGIYKRLYPALCELMHSK